MKPLITAVTATLAIATIAAPASALTGRHAEEFRAGLGNKYSNRQRYEFYEGLDNKSNRQRQEFSAGLGNKLTERFEQASRRNLDR